MGMIDVVVSGAAGRTGSNVIKAILTSEGMQLVGAVEAPGHASLGSLIDGRVTVASDLSDAANPGAVVVHFSAPAATMKHLEMLRDKPVCCVVGTTGFTDTEQKRIKYIAAKIPIVQSHNYGLGMNFFYALVQQATRYLKDRFDIEIVEFHGGEKKDAPSGTAGTIAGKIAAVKDLDLEEVAVYSRKGLRKTERNRDEIGISSIRGGTYKSDHTVIFAGSGERIELTHREESPDIIVQGVLMAIEFIHGREPGWYGMEDVLGL